MPTGLLVGSPAHRQPVIIPPRIDAALAEAEERSMEFAEVLAQVIDLLAREKRLSYRALKLRFHLDDEYLEGLKSVHIPPRVSAPVDAPLTRDAADPASPLAPRSGAPQHGRRQR
jgi:hypothetical protein